MRGERIGGSCELAAHRLGFIIRVSEAVQLSVRSDESLIGCEPVPGYCLLRTLETHLPGATRPVQPILWLVFHRASVVKMQFAANRQLS